jgi:hypothetical protein
VLKGGRLVAFEDPACLVDEQADESPACRGGVGSQSLTRAWASKWCDQVVADLAAARPSTRQGPRRALPTWLSLRAGANVEREKSRRVRSKA